MDDDLLYFDDDKNVTAQIKVIGVGGGGSNAVNYMYRQGIADVGFLVCNTDAQALKNSPVPNTIQLGADITGGRGAGNMPELGRQAAEEATEQIRSVLKGTTNMAFITAGMGGGTGTGATPFIAQICRELDILTIAIVTVPSKMEGNKRYNQALLGIDQMREHVDSLLVINNEKIRDIYGNLPASQAFAKADEILATAVKGIAEIITLHGNINIDFADVNTVFSGSKVFIMGTGHAKGENRAIEAVDQALLSPLLDSNDINGTNDILLNITSGEDEITMGEVGEIIEYLQDKAGLNANIIWGNGHDAKLTEEICVTIIATGFKKNPSAILQEIEKEPEEFIPFESNEEVFLNDEDQDTEVKDEKPEPEFEKKKDTIGQEPIRKKESAKKKKAESWLKRQLDLFFDDESADLE